jgi:hypothetical protein
MTINFARRLFLVAGAYGMVVIVPMFFLENQFDKYDPPGITHPEFYYGFALAALAWQIVYLMMSRDPLGLRPMLIPAVVGKAGFALSVLGLVILGRIPALRFILPSIDLLLAGFFIWAYVALGRLRFEAAP